MRKRSAVTAAIIFAVAIMIIIPFNGFILPSTAVAQQQRIDSNTSSCQGTNSSSNPLSQHYIQASREFCGTNNKQDNNSWWYENEQDNNSWWYENENNYNTVVL